MGWIQMPNGPSRRAILGRPEPVRLPDRSRQMPTTCARSRWTAAAEPPYSTNLKSPAGCGLPGDLGDPVAVELADLS
jgi:hypothetical protein